MRTLSRCCAMAAAVASAALLVAPALAQGIDQPLTLVPPEQRLTPVKVFLNAAPLVKLVMAALAASAATAVGFWVAQIAGRRTRPGTLAFYAGLEAGGPLLGLLGAVYGLLNGFLGISNIRPAPSLTVVAPGIAEALLCFGLGLFAAVVAVACRWHLKAQVEAAAHALQAR